MQSMNHVSRQLFNDGYLDVSKLNRESSKRYQMVKRSPNGTSVRVMPVLASALGMNEVGAKAAQKESPPQRVGPKTPSKDDEFAIG